jgi:hypothetical protein
MKVTELFESKKQMGKYVLPYSMIHRGHRTAERLYNFVGPELAKMLGVPVRSIKLATMSYSSGAFVIKITSAKTDVELVDAVAPKALKTLLDKCGFRKVETSSLGISRTETGASTVRVAFEVEFPEEWLRYDREKYGF